MSTILVVAVLACVGIAYSTAHPPPCPVIQCPDDPFIPERCKKPQYVIGSDNITKCRDCDGSFCDFSKCPQIQCPDDHTIPKDCRRPSFQTSFDGITPCRFCDSNICAPCPLVNCPKIHISEDCKIQQYFIGDDGITLCEKCPKSAC